MKTVAFVPIKLNNERLPNKNTLPLGGKPLCRHLLDTLAGVELLDEVYVFCSSERIREHLPGRVKFLARDAALDAYWARHYDIVRAFVGAVGADVYVNAHVTNPFIRRETIIGGINAIAGGGHDCALAVSEIREHLWLGGKPFNFEYGDPPRTQDLEPLYAETGVFMYRKEVFANSGTRYGKNPFFMVIDKIEAVDINYRDDYELAQAVCRMRDSRRQGPA
ncbi:MAG: acylneuraminate cytidylyltransferase family protein [Clostridiales bacterium]|jgi:CMP-N-acetylneuraminic acid synthetase|nr:acylneuraminate cytidylyltransferase family protein [Clostridiales bacterium]